MQLRWIAALGLLASCGVPRAAATPPDDAPHKVFVCKYVDKPGEAERLQTGQNPISVDVASIPLGDVHVGSEFADAQGRSVVIAFDEGQPEPSVSDCPPPHPPTTTTTQHVTTTTEKPHETTTTKPHETTTTVKSTTTTEKPHQTTTTAAATTTTQKPTTTTAASSTTSTTLSTPTTTTTQPGVTTTTGPPSISLFGVNVFPLCLADGTVGISITFGNRPDLDGDTGELQISAVPSGTIVANELLTFQSGTTVTTPYPPIPVGSTGVTLVYMLNGEQATATIGPPPTNCAEVTTTTGATTSTTTTSSLPPTTTSSSTSTTVPSTTTTAPPGGTTTTTPAPFAFGAAATVCVAEVPTIEIVFQNRFPELAGHTGTLTMSDINGNVVSTQSLVYQLNTTVHLLYPGTSVNPDGSIADVPGWILQSNGLWVRDPSDEFLRAGINLTYTVNPTATAFITYPPESSTCANPPGPFAPPPGGPGQPGTPGQPGQPGAPTPPATGLPPTGPSYADITASIAALTLAAGAGLTLVARRRRS